MDIADLADLPLVSRIALGYCPPARRTGLGVALALDHRLAQLVARTQEAMLGQMRLAWWREALQQSPALRSHGDAVLDAVTQGWPGPCAPLVALVDGWEHLLAPEPLDEAAARHFAEGRVSALVAACGCEAAAAGRAAQAARVWALADLAAKVSDESERRLLVALGQREASRRTRLTPDARALAVLGALGARALRRGGRPLMEGRSAALVAAKAAILLR